MSQHQAGKHSFSLHNPPHSLHSQSTSHQLPTFSYLHRPSFSSSPDQPQPSPEASTKPTPHYPASAHGPPASTTHPALPPFSEGPRMIQLVRKQMATVDESPSTVSQLLHSSPLTDRRGSRVCPALVKSRITATFHVRYATAFGIFWH